MEGEVTLASVLSVLYRCSMTQTQGDTMTHSQQARAIWIESELLSLSLSMDNCESGRDFDRAEEVGRHMDRLENELDALYGYQGDDHPAAPHPYDWNSE